VKPQTSSRAATSRRRTRGITLIELSLVVIVIGIMAALIEPSYAHVKDGLAQRAFVNNLRSEIVRGRLQAIKDGQIVTLQYDPAGSQFTLSEPPVPDANSTQTPELVTDLQNQQASQTHAISIPSGVSFSDFKTGTTDQGSGTWQLHFYPDGTSDGGGAQVTIGKSTQSILVDTQGNPTMLAAPLPDTTNDIWTSGIYDQRTTS
jgi:Tfp pilus assembly protein FimT